MSQPTTTVERPAAAGMPEHYPLSFGQEQLWFLQQLDASSSAYNLSAAVRVRGAVEERAVRAALNEIVRRHDVLRTRYEMDENGNAVQVVDPCSPASVPTLDLRG